MTPPNPSEAAREAATKIVESYCETEGPHDKANAIHHVEAIIQSALDSAQRPYVEWIMKAYHPESCGAYGWADDTDSARRDCTCGLSKLRDELRKQVGGEK